MDKMLAVAVIMSKFFRSPPAFGILTVANILGVCFSFYTGSAGLFFLFVGAQALLMAPGLDS